MQRTFYFASHSAATENAKISPTSGRARGLRIGDSVIVFIGQTPYTRVAFRPSLLSALSY
jgi:hypothetical protein